MQSYYKDKHIAVTGSSGFLGHYLCAALHEQGARIYATSSRRHHDLRKEDQAHNFVREAYIHLNDHIDILFHLAATVSGIQGCASYPYEHIYDNTAMGLNILHASYRFGVRDVVVSGSVCSYPLNVGIPTRETELWNGLPEYTNASYGLAKRHILALQQALYQEYGVHSSHLLIANLYGPRDNFNPASSHVIPALIRKFHDASEGGGPVIVWGTGNPTRDFLYVEDAIMGLLAAGEKIANPDPINLSSNSPISIAELAHMIADMVGYHGEIIFDPNRPDGQPKRNFDNRKAEKLLGWRPRVPIDQGLKRTIAWYRTQAEAGNMVLSPPSPPIMAS